MRTSVFSGPGAIRSTQIGFPMVVLQPGEEKTVSVDLKDAVRAQKLIILATMAEIRGRYRIKYSRLPLIDREEMHGAFTQIKRRASKRSRAVPGKTVLLFEHPVTGKLIQRDYLPSSIHYIPTEAAEYIVLRQLFHGPKNEPAMPSVGGGVTALMFGPGVLGNGLYVPTAEVSMGLTFKNDGDVVVTVSAMIFGTVYEKQAQTVRDLLR